MRPGLRRVATSTSTSARTATRGRRPGSPGSRTGSRTCSPSRDHDDDTAPPSPARPRERVGRRVRAGRARSRSSRGSRRRTVGRGRRPGPLRVLPRHGAPVGRRLPDRHCRRASTPSSTRSTPRSASTASSWSTSTTRARSWGRCADRHEHVGAGRIGGAGLARMLTHPALGHVVYMLETPGMEDGYDAVNIARAKALAAGEPARGPAAGGVRHAEREGPQRPRGPRGERSRVIALAKAQRPRRTPRPTPTTRTPPAGAGLTAPVDRDTRIGLQDVLCLVGILVLAIATRLPGLALRGQWDADQGNELLVLLALGPRRPGAAPRPVDVRRGRSTTAPSTTTCWRRRRSSRTRTRTRSCSTITLLGLATVAAIWALGYAVGGRWTAHVAGVLAAASPALVLELDVHLEPEPRAPRRRARAPRGRARLDAHAARWWLLAAVGCMVTMQLHVCGGLLVPPLAASRGSLDLARRPTGERGPVAARGRSAALAIVAAGYLPLLVHELQTGFAETRAASSATSAAGPASARAGTWWRGCSSSAFRSLAWPFTGVITEAPMASAAVTVIVILLLGVAFRGGGIRARPGLVLFTGTLLWSLARARAHGAHAAQRRPGPPQRPLPHVPRPARARRRGDGDRGGGRVCRAVRGPEGVRRPAGVAPHRSRARARGARRARRDLGLALAPGCGRRRRVAARRRGGRAAHRGPGRRGADARRACPRSSRRTRSASRSSGAAPSRWPRSPERTRRAA